MTKAPALEWRRFSEYGGDAHITDGWRSHPGGATRYDALCGGHGVTVYDDRTGETRCVDCPELARKRRMQAAQDGVLR